MCDWLKNKRNLYLEFCRNLHLSFTYWSKFIEFRRIVLTGKQLENVYNLHNHVYVKKLSPYKSRDLTLKITL